MCPEIEHSNYLSNSLSKSNSFSYYSQTNFTESSQHTKLSKKNSHTSYNKIKIRDYQIDKNKKVRIKNILSPFKNHCFLLCTTVCGIGLLVLNYYDFNVHTFINQDSFYKGLFFSDAAFLGLSISQEINNLSDTNNSVNHSNDTKDNYDKSSLYIDYGHILMRKNSPIRLMRNHKRIKEIAKKSHYYNKIVQQINYKDNSTYEIDIVENRKNLISFKDIIGKFKVKLHYNIIYNLPITSTITHLLHILEKYDFYKKEKSSTKVHIIKVSKLIKKLSNKVSFYQIDQYGVKLEDAAISILSLLSTPKMNYDLFKLTYYYSEYIQKIQKSAKYNPIIHVNELQKQEEISSMYVRSLSEIMDIINLLYFNDLYIYMPPNIEVVLSELDQNKEIIARELKEKDDEKVLNEEQVLGMIDQVIAKEYNEIQLEETAKHLSAQIIEQSYNSIKAEEEVKIMLGQVIDNALNISEQNKKKCTTINEKKENTEEGNNKEEDNKLLQNEKIIFINQSDKIIENDLNNDSEDDNYKFLTGDSKQVLLLQKTAIDDDIKDTCNHECNYDNTKGIKDESFPLLHLNKHELVYDNDGVNLNKYSHTAE